MEKGEFKQQKMVNWYHPKMLLSIAIKAVISGTFGNYADRRELEAALDSNVDTAKEWEQLIKEYGKGTQNDIWIDIVNDTGDGFDATFAIAKSAGKKQLKFCKTDKHDEVITQRGQLLIFGGDEVYPFPTQENYDNRFKIPFGSAVDDPAEINKKTGRPHLYAIPGNHDWYDGLGNFIKIFCQQRYIGIWSTKQHRSYFAVPLSNRYWIWATDIQLNSDIDAPQLKYFKSIIEKMDDGDKVILISAEPAWVYDKIHKKDRSFERLKFFIDDYIYDKKECHKKKFKLAATITGDLHHYARYCADGNKNGHQYITAGGGGAYLCLTHKLPEYVSSMNEKDEVDKKEDTVRLRQAFPSEDESKKLLLGNFLFPIKNKTFTGLIWALYFFLYWIIESNQLHLFTRTIIPVPNFSAYSLGLCGLRMLYTNPGIVILIFALGGCFYAFADTKIKKYKEARIAGVLHGLAQIVNFCFVIYFICMMESCLKMNIWALRLAIPPIMCFLGSVTASFLMGSYLYVTNRWLGMHIDESSSSLASPHYKNFLRLRIHRKGVTIYPIGIEKVPKNWRQSPTKDKDVYLFEGNEIKTILIEPPIEIEDEKLK